jgi:L-aspartate oxidase
MRALIERVRGSASIDIWEQTFTIDLLTHAGECRGALVWNGSHGKTFVWAKQTILATGGAGRLYRETTNSDVATADGQAAAFRAGAQVRDMEMMQFHPTVLYIAGSSRHLISEAVRGEGAPGRCGRYRFMHEYDPRGERAAHIVAGQSPSRWRNHSPCVYCLGTSGPAWGAVSELGQVCRGSVGPTHDPSRSARAPLHDRRVDDRSRQRQFRACGRPAK